MGDLKGGSGQRSSFGGGGGLAEGLGMGGMGGMGVLGGGGTVPIGTSGCEHCFGFAGIYRWPRFPQATGKRVC